MMMMDALVVLLKELLIECWYEESILEQFPGEVGETTYHLAEGEEPFTSEEILTSLNAHIEIEGDAEQRRLFITLTCPSMRHTHIPQWFIIANRASDYPGLHHPPERVWHFWFVSGDEDYRDYWSQEDVQEKLAAMGFAVPLPLPIEEKG